jgi:hypothetical protein
MMSFEVFSFNKTHIKLSRFKNLSNTPRPNYQKSHYFYVAFPEVVVFPLSIKVNYGKSIK